MQAENARMSRMSYNGIEFDPNGWLTLGFNQEAVYDESGTDMECVRITISGQCVLSAPLFPTGELDDDESGDSDDPAITNPKLRLITNFMTPRKNLSFTVNGQQMIPQLDGDEYSNTKVDARNGPLPQYFNVTQLTEKSFLCNLAIVSHWAEKSFLTDNSNILSHRWTDSVDIDQNHYTTMTRTGKIKVSSAAYTSSGGAGSIDGLRKSLMTTGIRPGFVRRSSRYTLHPSGLEMGYAFTDVEEFRMPPKPVTTAAGDFSISTQLLGSPGKYATMQVKFQGPKMSEANPANLIRKAVAVCMNKIRGAGGFFPIKADLRESLYKNEVEVFITGRVKTPANEKALSLLTSFKGIGTAPLGSDFAAEFFGPGDRGTGSVLLHAAAFQDPTLGQTIDPQNWQLQVAGGLKPIGQVPGG